MIPHSGGSTQKSQKRAKNRTRCTGCNISKHIKYLNKVHDGAFPKCTRVEMIVILSFENLEEKKKKKKKKACSFFFPLPFAF